MAKHEPVGYADHVYAVMGGSLTQATGTDEEWQSGFRVTLDSGTTAAEYLQQIGAKGDTPQDGGYLWIWWQAPSGHTSADATLDYVKVYEVTSTSETPVGEITYGTGPSGTTARQWPSLCCLAYTFETATPKGPGGRGRCYVPNQYPFIGSTIDPGVMAGAANDAKALAYAVQGGSTNAVAQLVMASRTFGTLLPIVAVSVDNVIDTQRRRKKQLVPARTRETL